MILCGKGNNGGDGFVVARRLAERGAALRVILFADPAQVGGDAAENLKLWEKSGRGLGVVKDMAGWDAAQGVLADADLLVDALLGTGLTGPVEGLLAAVIEAVNAERGRRPRGLRV